MMNWFHKLLNKTPRPFEYRGPARQRLRRQADKPSLEFLEDRIAPATHTWVGPTAGGSWSNPANWDAADGVPTTGEVGGTIVQFNGGIASTDNLAGLIVDQVHFTAGGNTILGTTALGIAGDVLFDNVVSDSGVNTFDTTLPLVNNSTADTFFLVSSGTVNVNGDISGNTGIRLVNGSANGTLTLAGNLNDYTGGTNVDDGTLLLNSNGVNTAVPHDLTIGDDIGAPNSAVVRFLQSDEIDPTATVTVNSDGLFDLNGNFQSITNLSILAGNVSTGAGGLVSLSGTLSYTGTAGSDTVVLTGLGVDSGTLSTNGATPFAFSGPSS